MNSAQRHKLRKFQKKILKWYESNGRHDLPWRVENLDTYEIIIAEVLLQRTKAETIQKIYLDFLKVYPTWDAIIQKGLGALETSLIPIGLYRQRSKRLMALALEMKRREGKLPSNKEELSAIPLFGQYIANAIILQVFKEKRPLLDVNMARVLERYFGERKLADIRYDPYLQELAQLVVEHPKSKDINWAILDFASKICKSKVPLCLECLLSKDCYYYNNWLSITYE